MSYVDEVYENVVAKNPNEPEFHQAVKEVLDSLRPVIDANEEKYRKEALLERIVEPERVIWRAAAERKIAPTFVGLTTFSRIAILLASLHMSSTAGKAFLCIPQSIPLVIANPVSFLSTASSAVYTGISCHCSRISSASRSRSESATRKEIGLYPATRALRITFGLSPIKIPGAGSAYRNNCTSDNLA